MRRAASAPIAAVAALLCGAAASPAVLSREIVAFEGRSQPGTILIRTAERRLYLVRGDGTAIR